MFERKKLGLLQPNLQGKLSYQGGKIVLEPPISRKRKNDENQTPLKSIRKDGIYEDPITPLTKRAKHSPAVLGVDAGVQTEQMPKTPTANCPTASGSKTITAIASTSHASDAYSDSFDSVSGPQAEKLGSMPATQSQEGKSVTKSDEFKTPNEKRLLNSSKVTQSGAKDRVAEQQSTGSKSFSEKRRTSRVAQADIDMLTSDLPGERYWEMLAAERKAALISTLAENKQLYERNTELQDRVYTLESENALLEKWLQETKLLANMLESVVGEEDIPEDGDQQTTPAVDSAAENLVEKEEQPLAEPLPAN